MQANTNDFQENLWLTPFHGQNNSGWMTGEPHANDVSQLRFDRRRKFIANVSTNAEFMFMQSCNCVACKQRVIQLEKLRLCICGVPDNLNTI